MSASWNWSGVAWHWVLYVLAAVVLAALAAAWLYYRDPPDEVATFEAELDAADPTVALREFTDLPGPVSDSPAATTLRMSADARTSRAGGLQVAAETDFGAWLTDCLSDLAVLAWDARIHADRCWEILHVEFPRLRAELGIAA